jgi:hypothetical protein
MVTGVQVLTSVSVDLVGEQPGQLAVALAEVLQRRASARSVHGHGGQ